MEAVTFTSGNCPECGKSTALVNIVSEPPREVCGRFGCSWDGENL